MSWSGRSGLVVHWFVTVLLAAITVNGWRVVFKVSRGTNGSPDLGGMASMYKLWNSSEVMNDNPGGYHQASLSYMSPYQPTYKSSIVNQWHEQQITYSKLAIYQNGKEGAYVVFNARGTDKGSWFNSSLIMSSSYTDLNRNEPTKFSLEGSYNDLRFSALQHNGSICYNPGWFAVVDDDIRSFCLNKTENTPYFVYSPDKRSSLLKDGAIGNAFAIFVDDCVVNPCENDGTCATHIDGHSCQCVDQQFGHNCQYKCPCEQRATCLAINSSHVNSKGEIHVNGVFINDQYVSLDQHTMVACKCPAHYYGDICQNTTLQCASSPCLNQGVCLERYSDYTCVCSGDYMGKRCNVPKPVPKESGLNTGAKVALGLCLPLIIIIILAIIFIVYTFHNPEAYGHEATVKQYTIAREFVRRSIRRVSGRRPKQMTDTKDTVAFSPKEKEVSEGQVNLGFQDVAKHDYGRQSSEYYDLSATDNAVVSGKTSKYPTYPAHNHPSGHLVANKNNERPPIGQENEFYKEYRPAQLHGSDSYTHPGHRYDEYNKLDNEVPSEPIPQPRKQRQTGRRGRQTSQDNDQQIGTLQQYTPSQHPDMDESGGFNEPRRQRQNELRGGYNGQIVTPNSLRTNSRPDHDQRLPSYDESRLPSPNTRSPSYNDPRLSPGYGQNENIPKENMRRSPGYNQNIPHQQQHNKDPRYTPGYGNNEADYERYDNRRMPDDRHIYQELKPGYRSNQPSHYEVDSRTPRSNGTNGRKNEYYNQAPPRHSSGNIDPQYSRYPPDEIRGQRSDDRIVFTSTEPMNDVTV